MTIAGINNIRYSQQILLTSIPQPGKKLVVAEWVQICDTASRQCERIKTLQNGCALYDVILTFRTQSDPKNFDKARGWMCQDRSGKDWLIGYGDEDDYPVVTWTNTNSKSETPDYQVSVSFKSRVGVFLSTGGVIDF